MILALLKQDKEVGKEEGKSDFSVEKCDSEGRRRGVWDGENRSQ